LVASDVWGVRHRGLVARAGGDVEGKNKFRKV